MIKAIAEITLSVVRDGIGIKEIDVLYKQSNSSSSAPDIPIDNNLNGWSTTAPQWINGQYIWTINKTLYSNNKIKYSQPICITGEKGNSGDNGQGIDSITEEYYLSNSKITQEGGEWVEQPPSWSKNKYIWTRTKIKYMNPIKIEYTTPICSSEWEAVKDLDQSVQQDLDDVENNIIDTNSILLAIKKDINEINGKVSSNTNKITMTHDYTDFVNTSVQNIQNIVDGKVSQEELNEYVRIGHSSIEIGKSDSPFKLILTNNKMSFFQGTEEVAYISNNEMYILQARIAQELQIGAYILKDEGPLGLSLMKRGDAQRCLVRALI